ncbi:MAG: hypothetical protein ACRDIB_15630, partial [Ardenticatenaceae bacterium]
MKLFGPSRPYRSFRGGCCGCASLLALLAVLGVSALCFGLWHLLATPAGAAPLGEGEVVQLVAAIPEGTAQDKAVGIFGAGEVVLAYGGGPLWLASTPDGTGAIVTDDRVTIEVTRPDGTWASWVHTFASADGARVEAIPPQEL